MLVTLNAIFLLCKRNRLTVSAFARLTGIERTRAHRLVHAAPERLREMLTIREAIAIAGAFPFETFDY